MKRKQLEWKVHTANLFQEVLNNHGTGVLTQPFRILGSLLAQVAERAIELDDPKLNILMLRLTLYEQADPEKHSSALIDKAYASQRKRVA